MRKFIIPIVVIIFIFLLNGLFIGSLRRSVGANMEYYDDISNYEWDSLRFYSAKPQNYLGKYTNNIFCSVYNLQGIEENELLYLKGTCDLSPTYSDGKAYFIINTDFEEPVKRFPIKEIIITKSDGSVIKVDDTTILNQMEQILQNSAGSVHSYVEDFNASVNFESSCDLSWLCIIEKRTNGSIFLIGYDEKMCKFVEFDVTDILESAWQE